MRVVPHAANVSKELGSRVIRQWRVAAPWQVFLLLAGWYRLIRGEKMGGSCLSHSEFWSLGPKP